MGTLFRIVVYAIDQQSSTVSVQAAFDRIAQLEGVMSDYRPDSELVTLSRKAGTGEVVVSQDLFSILQLGQKWARATDGAFDVTVGPVVRLWRRARRSGEIPALQDLERATALVGYRYLELYPSRRAARLVKPGMSLDLGGIAKGFAADQAVQVLKSRGLRSILVAAGGDIAVADAPPGSKGWKIAIASVDSSNSNQGSRILLANAAVSTSGDAEQFFEIEGTRYSHIVNPRTGIGMTGKMSATVVAPDAATSDALATALNVIEPERGVKLIDATRGAATLIVARRGDGFRSYASRRWKGIRSGE